jgi:hypothetical protein
VRPASLPPRPEMACPYHLHPVSDTCSRHQARLFRHTVLLLYCGLVALNSLANLGSLVYMYAIGRGAGRTAGRTRHEYGTARPPAAHHPHRHRHRHAAPRRSLTAKSTRAQADHINEQPYTHIITCPQIWLSGRWYQNTQSFLRGSPTWWALRLV